MYAKLQPDKNASNSEHGGIVKTAFLITGSDPAKLFETSKKVLKAIALTIDELVERPRTMRIGFAGDSVTDTPAGQERPKTATAVAFVTHQPFRAKAGPTTTGSSDFPLGKQLFSQALFMPLTGGQSKGYRLALALGSQVDFGTPPAPAASQRLGFGCTFFAPAAGWWARTTLPSRKWISQSNSPCPSRSACTPARRSSHTPAFRQRWKRLYIVVHFPYRSGKSRHGAPVRSTHSIPFITCRSSRAGRPRFPCWGSRRFSFSPCSLLKSPRFIGDSLITLFHFAYTL